MATNRIEPGCHGNRLQIPYRSNRSKLCRRVVCKLFDLWSGRRDSNPRRPAWEIEGRLKIQNMARTVSIPVDGDGASFQSVARRSLLMD
jgi:hypothetical protein